MELGTLIVSFSDDLGLQLSTLYVLGPKNGKFSDSEGLRLTTAQVQTPASFQVLSILDSSIPQCPSS